MAPSISPEQLRALRLKYNAAYSAYQSHAEALGKVTAAGDIPSHELLEDEMKALRDLAEARANLLAGMRSEPLPDSPPCSRTQRHERS